MSSECLPGIPADVEAHQTFPSQPTLELFDTNDQDNPIGNSNFHDKTGKWGYDSKWLHNALVNGDMKLSDETLQRDFLEYISTPSYMEMVNSETAEWIYIPVPKRGDKRYAIKKGKMTKEIADAMSKISFDEPVPGFRNLRRTRMLFTTLTFDHDSFTAEEAWASLKSTRPEGSDNLYNVINGFDANISKIFGTHGKLTSKEGQGGFYPAPHLLVILDDYVIVQRKKVRGTVRWYPMDEGILKRLGKDLESRKLSKEDYKAAIENNPVWKHGFFDIEGVVSDQKFKGRNSVISYITKYLCKCLTDSRADAVSSLNSIADSKDHSQRIALTTHYCNKCFNNRDITYGKGFKERIGLLVEKKKEEDSEPSPWIFMGIVGESVYQSYLKSKTKSEDTETWG